MKKLYKKQAAELKILRKLAVADTQETTKDISMEVGLSDSNDSHEGGSEVCIK